MFCCILGSLLFLICIEFVYLYFPVLFCLSVSVKRLAVKTASEMTYIVSSGALNSTPTNQPRSAAGGWAVGRSTRRRSVGRSGRSCVVRCAVRSFVAARPPQRPSSSHPASLARPRPPPIQTVRATLALDRHTAVPRFRLPVGMTRSSVVKRGADGG